MSTWTGPLPYFSASEIACNHCGKIELDQRFAAALPALRLAWGSPLTPTSICRCPEWNAHEDVKGHASSLHLTTNPKWPTHGSMAADIYWKDWPTEEKLKFARLAWSLGWSVGLHNSFCHVDLRSLACGIQSTFLYGTWNNAFDSLEVIVK